ncbi:potassium transporter KefA [Lactococcus hodotermopsidis]|uniref:Potassium transporter KefA n=1 Tax=Pseudolactococcus hodotermopsidis TaxID=2709157 RepID=A0A6A0BBY3_9LACT|nr:mechanosensitive ion channel domain-containing protein [Lactococcus hodotermopsidis]GFH41981.1 potassium transporter KefA [Lactococcus hodotermopsidis]
MKFLHLETFFETTLEKFVQLLLATVLFYIFYRLLKLIIKRLFDKYSQTNIADSARVLTLSRLIQSTFQYLTIFLYIYTVLGIFGLPVGSLLAGAGIIGVALGFAGRDLMSDVINGFFIIVEHQVNVGDIVSFKNLDISGTVKTIGIRSMTLTGSNGALIFIPNRHITALANLSRTQTSLFLDVPITYVANVSELKNRLLKVNESYPNADFIGVITDQDKVYLRTKLTGNYSDISSQKATILSQYYEKNG